MRRAPSVLAALQSIPFSSGDIRVTSGAIRTGPFASPQCLHALYQVLAGVQDFSVGTVGDNAQLHTSVLSYYRALLLKEKVGRGAFS